MRNIGAVVLAAGGSSRLGQPKQLLKFRGKTLVQRAVEAAAKAGCDPVIVVVGKFAQAIRGEIDILGGTDADGATGVIIIENAEWRSGIGTSIRRGLQQLPESIEAAVLLTSDQPFVDAAIVTQLIEAHDKTGQPIVASRYAGTLGVPALFARSFFDALLTLPGDLGAKSIIQANPDETAAVEFDRGAIDIDSPEDFERLKENRG